MVALYVLRTARARTCSSSKSPPVLAPALWCSLGPRRARVPVQENLLQLLSPERARGH